MIETEDLIGIPFDYGGRGPETYDCYGLLMECWRRAYGVELPEFRSSRIAARNALVMARNMHRWREVEARPGAGVLLKTKGGVASHVGFLLEQDRMIHTWEKSGGVLIEPLWGDWRNRIVGFYDYAV